MTEKHIRLGCHRCDRDDYDGDSAMPTDWDDIHEVQSLEASRKEGADGDESPFDWHTHLGTCPDCREEECYGS